ncbi:Arc family DNA-binding protein [Vibrio harveyi]|uniref:Arc family DNA-binding protein n=1 Tax=Vibrio harveyi TaxID=669 RepID=A0A8B3DNZ9_VIBHA|nr:Arc family DNA-binding protein [Vibrio harveyi]RIW13237.1 Arc family DNA-binding protein [Vibrio harveyi]WDZ72827.1 Arc family DNA-binding protein [Vibrio harveyi]HDM8071269.1 Arc family DNA-binding protein [Vibrio harveyi]
MSRDIAPFGLRMQSELKEKLEAIAKENKRSLNAEITSRLESTVSQVDELFISAEEAKLLAIESQGRIKERILKKTFRDILMGIEKGLDRVFVDLDDFNLDEMDDPTIDELLAPTEEKLKELGYDFEPNDVSFCIKLIR